MSRVLIFSFILLNITILRSQIKVAVLDFENTSTIEKYDGFGKAMSNMLLTDLKNNIHPRKISFLERSQLNKILNEQQLQNTKNFDKNTAVTFGKLAGVKYVILGGVYVLDGVCNLNSRMVDVESSEIIYAKESNGKITDWLNLKTKLAEELSSELNNPIQIEEEYTNVEVNEGTISQYSKVIELLESGELEEASKLLSVLTSIQPDFKYLDELKFDIEQLKEQVAKNTTDIAENREDISTLNKSGGLVIEVKTINEYINNLKSDLLDFKEKRKLFRELFLKFDYDQMKLNFTEIAFLNYKNWYSTDVSILKDIINQDLEFINDLNSDVKKKLYLETTLNEILLSLVYNKSLKSDLFNEIELISKNLFKLYNFKYISEKEFLYFIFSGTFSVNEYGENSNDLLKSKLLGYIDSIDNPLKSIISGYTKEDLSNNIHKIFKDKNTFKDIYILKNLFDFGMLTNIAMKIDDEIFEKKGKIKANLINEIKNELSSQFSPPIKDYLMVSFNVDVKSNISKYVIENVFGYSFKEE